MKGWTLIELCAVLLILGLGIGLGYPHYRQLLLEQRRAEAHQQLQSLAIQLEEAFARTRSYANAADIVSDTSRKSRFYRISVNHSGCKDRPTIDCFELRAHPAPDGPQQQDRLCPELRLDHQGRRTPRQCWP